MTRFVIVGGGPSGLSAAIRLKQLNPEMAVCLGMKVIVPINSWHAMSIDNHLFYHCRNLVIIGKKRSFTRLCLSPYHTHCSESLRNEVFTLLLNCGGSLLAIYATHDHITTVCSS